MFENVALNSFQSPDIAIRHLGVTGGGGVNAIMKLVPDILPQIRSCYPIKSNQTKCVCETIHHNRQSHLFSLLLFIREDSFGVL